MKPPTGRGVGTSPINTPYKHLIIDRMCGTEFGMLTHRRGKLLDIERLMVVDMTAGDAADQNSTPQLLLKHAERLFPHLFVEVHLCESTRTTFQHVRDSTDPQHSGPH